MTQIIDMNPRRRKLLVTAVVVCIVAGMGTRACPQSKKQSYPAHLPYSFSNFAWWSDTQLRNLLKKRIPGLRDEVATTGDSENRIRKELTALLKGRGVDAQVMSEEPSLSVLQPAPIDFLGFDADDGPPVPKPSVSFMIVSPSILIGTIKVEANANDAELTTKQELQGDEGRQFTEGSLSFTKYEIEKSVRKLGYFDAEVQLHHESPHKSGDSYLVNEIVEVNTGPRFRIGSLTVDSGPLLIGRDLSRFFTVRTGDVAVPSPFGQLGMALRAYYERRGYADVHIVTKPVLDHEHATVSFALKVQPGPVYHLRTLKIENLRPDQEKRVREIFGMKPGGLYRDQAIQELYGAIAHEPLLKGYTLSYSPNPDRADAVVDLTLEFDKKGGKATVTIQ